jgi:hypothetical protein
VTHKCHMCGTCGTSFVAPHFVALYVYPPMIKLGSDPVTCMGQSQNRYVREIF